MHVTTGNGPQEDAVCNERHAVDTTGQSVLFVTYIYLDRIFRDRE